jgi:predicted transcriptional regulator
MTDALTPISIMNISDFLIAQAEEQVRNAGLRIADQQAVVESLERRGYGDLTAHARALLAAFERFHKIIAEHRSTSLKRIDLGSCRAPDR